MLPGFRGLDIRLEISGAWDLMFKVKDALSTLNYHNLPYCRFLLQALIGIYGETYSRVLVGFMVVLGWGLVFPGRASEADACCGLGHVALRPWLSGHGWGLVS